MRLLTKSTIYFIITTPFIFLISGIFIYFFLQSLLLEEVDEELSNQKILLLKEFSLLQDFKNFKLPTDGSITVSGNPLLYNLKPIFSDTLIFSDLYGEYLPYRQLKFTASTQNEKRLITIRKSKLENEDLAEGIIYSLSLAFLIMIIAFVIINAMIVQKLWDPFRRILNNMKGFNFRTGREFEPVMTNIYEFNELNHELTKMTNKLKQDYFALKEFSENASHEMQTPLAVIRAKLELLFQQKGLNEENIGALKSAYQAANRLSRLHHELNLLTRIENMEFKEKQRVNLGNLLENQIENFSDMIENKNLQFTVKNKENFFVDGNAYLLEILLSNLLTNAIKHNRENGQLKIDLNGQALIICNSGPAPSLPPETFFERFRKGHQGSDSLGLGLSLAKQICMVHNFDLSYEYKNNLHILTVSLGNYN